MKKLMLLLCFFFIKKLVISQETRFPENACIYFVRHAEKETGKDPGLTEAVKKRAGDLARLLKDKNIKRLYVTSYRRSEMTMDSMRIQLGIDTLHYAADTTGQDLISNIKKSRDDGRSVLVVGHSNTVLQMIRALGIQVNLPGIPDNEFDNLYLVKFKKGKAYVEYAKYWASSGSSGAMKDGQ